jgi:hypothetical protein
MIMKKVLLIVIGIIACLSGNSQNKNIQDDIIGIWQLSTPEIGSGYLDNYQFFPDGKYVFNINEYDELKHIVAIKGRYIVSKDSLTIEPISLITCSGNKLDRSSSTSMHDSWSLSGTRIKSEIFLENQPAFTVKLVLVMKEEGHKSILIAGLEYFLVTKDPNEYE